MSIHSLLTHRATIERATVTVQSGGDTTVTWSTVATDVPCRIEVRRTETNLAPVGRVIASEIRGWFPGDTDLRPRLGQCDWDRVTVDGEAYRVVGARLLTEPGNGLLTADLEQME